MIDKQVLKTIRTMKRKDQEFRLIESKACVRRIDLNDAMRLSLSESFKRVLSWQGDNVQRFGIDLVWEGSVSDGHDQHRHIHYLVVALSGLAPATADEFDRVFFQGLEPTKSPL